MVGLDIGTSAVRAAELDISHSTPVLHTYGQVGLPPGSLVDGEIRDSSSVSEAITKLWKNGQFSSSSVIVGIAGLRAITREIDLPFVPDNEVDSAVRFQSEEVIPFPPEQTILSSQVLADYTSPEGDKMRRVLVAAAHVDLVNGVIDAVEKAGLTVEGVDLISSALVRAIGGQDTSEQPEAIVSIGAGLTVVVVHQQGRPQFVRTIGSGGNAATAAVSAALDIPVSDAEAVKRRIGEQVVQLQTAERASQASINELVGEIRNSIQYFASLPGRLPVSRVLVTGGGSDLYGFIPMLESQIRLPVVTVSPLARVDTSKLDLSAEQARQVEPGPGHAHRSRPSRAGQGGQEVQPPPPRGGRAHPDEADPGADHHGLPPPCSSCSSASEDGSSTRSTRPRTTSTALQANITALNAQVPKFDLVVAANDAYTAGVARRASVLNSAIDWPLVLGNLISITPAGAKVQTFDGATEAAASTPSSAAPRRRRPRDRQRRTPTSAATPTTSAAIGTVELNVTGPGPSLSISEAWINAVAGSQYFANPMQGATKVNADTTISFPFTISITPNASLDKNASLK